MHAKCLNNRLPYILLLEKMLDTHLPINYHLDSILYRATLDSYLSSLPRNLKETRRQNNSSFIAGTCRRHDHRPSKHWNRTSLDLI